MILTAARNDANADGHRMCAFEDLFVQDLMSLFKAVEAYLACFVGIIEGLVNRYGWLVDLLFVLIHHILHRYVYIVIQIALYGKPYIRAAKDTWRLPIDRGKCHTDHVILYSLTVGVASIDALVNDSLVGINKKSMKLYAFGH
jgi:hypothetical protein